jgi:cell wall-associated protease
MAKFSNAGLTMVAVAHLLLFGHNAAHAQATPDTTSAPQDWFLRDPASEQIQGMSVEKAYSLLQEKPSKTVVVAVVDSGIDIDHEDLKDVIWVNTDEIPGNNIDDDKNGYIDDVNGWNFIGGKNGDVNDDTNEVTREYKRLKPKYENIDEKKITKKNKAEYEYWKKVKAKYDRDSKFNIDQYNQFKQQYEMYVGVLTTVVSQDSILRGKLHVKTITRTMLDSIKSDDSDIALAKGILQRVFESVEQGVDMTQFIGELEAYLDYLDEALEHYKAAAETTYNLEQDPRSIVGDDYSNINERSYGNNHVQGGNPSHGTHVAGVIGANRTNNIGIKGIADNVKIMAVRVVPPSGDERDKDIANAIYYAVDNGARIINMSFGKAFSPNKAAVEKATHYAESKGVLLIHAAGNDGDDNDKDANFPNRYYVKEKKEAKNWLEVGASTWTKDGKLAASFSNYGKKSVDFFAPGVQIYSPEPGNEYTAVDGTSFASPATAGVAALIMSYFPDLKATQVRDILRQSTRKFDNLKVARPGTTELVDFSQLSNTGGVVNAYEAVKLATTLSKQSPESK